VIGLFTWPLAPAAVAYAALHPRLRRDLRGRLGLDVPPVQPGAVWVHASSVGEVGAADALLERWWGPALLTTDSDSGLRAARFSPAAVVPIDHPLFLAPLWAEARPRAVVFVEDALWPHLALRARAEGVPMLRVSARAGPGARRASWLHRACAPDAVAARDEAARAWFASVLPGVPVTIGGDLKAARTAPRALLRWSRPFVVGASTREGDEDRLLAAVDAIHPSLGVLLAPRHLERIATFRFPFVRRTTLLADEVPPGDRVVVLDTLGELRAAVVGAAATFVGGTFDERIGGHSPSEAHAAGVPVCAGPHVAAQGDAFEVVGADVGPDLDATLRAALARGRRPPSTDSDPARAAVDLVAGWLAAPARERSPRPWALPLSPLLRAGWPRRAHQLSVPVVSVGSANARGPGRTSTVRALVAVLAARGHTVGVAVSGYRRTSAGSDVRMGTDAADVGDEGALLAAAGALVAAGRDRRRAAQRLVEAGATCVVLDDGLRHTEVARDLDIVVVDARFPSARGPLPAGERRPSPSPRDGFVLVHHGGGLFDTPGLPAGRTPDRWTPRRPDGPVAAFAGIARPADFLATLDVPVARFLALPDHAPLDEELLRRFAGELPLVCTAKDAARLPSDMQNRVAWRDVCVRIPPSLMTRIGELLPM
jgi:tetraacyldisaccharide-1-P 4'-kinase/3-deoxy-D-manno-octulosonic-acid transferase